SPTLLRPHVSPNPRTVSRCALGHDDLLEFSLAAELGKLRVTAGPLRVIAGLDGAPTLLDGFCPLACPARNDSCVVEELGIRPRDLQGASRLLLCLRDLCRLGQC